ncbi:MAG TPA: class IV adenylate cyclase [Saprospiraceae bacterium]|nr:class IV adenylate cyclase [Saprospiraceae bacterium]
MKHTSIEIKAICDDPFRIIDWLEKNQARYIGEDIQTDTYFLVKQGRLKHREGQIENNLIYYERNDKAGPKKSKINIYPCTREGNLIQILIQALGMKVQVKKIRRIYIIETIKIHLDIVEGLGSFVEIEVFVSGEAQEESRGRTQCKLLMDKWGIKEGDLIGASYSDLMIAKNNRIL